VCQFHHSGSVHDGRHLETANLLFCDGHVKSLRLTNLQEKSIAIKWLRNSF
ncbi:MAG: hypothetical protein EOO01_27485, partial [Chitinophagaceae bacterium]